MMLLELNLHSVENNKGGPLCTNLSAVNANHGAAGS